MNILITAGPTVERIDPVRFISNRSSGKMGYALANSANRSGNNVTLISGPVSLVPDIGINLIKIESAAEMACEVRKFANSADLIIMAAAVADYRPIVLSEQKIKKTPGNLTIELERTEDIISRLGEGGLEATLVGFAAETIDVIKNAQDKLRRKGLDWIIANDVSRSDRGFGSENNAVTMISKDNKNVVLPLQNKNDLADEILAVLY